MRFEDFIGVNFWTALFTLLNFLLVFFVLKKFLYGPVMKMIQTRQQEIDDLYDSAGKAKASAEAMEAELQKKLSAAADTSEKLVKEAVARGQSREEEIIRKANIDAEAIRTKAAADIAREKKKAISEAKNEIADIAVGIAEKVIGRELTDDDQHRLIDHFVDELGEQL